MGEINIEAPRFGAVTWVFFGVLALAGTIYVYLGLTPSSYGYVLELLGAPEEGPIAGTPRLSRTDEWGVVTPLFQAAVRNGFREVNETSFYRENLRSIFPIPLRNWSLLFRPQLWAFFLTGPAAAYSFYFAFLICASLAGYYLLFRELGAGEWLAVAASITVFFSGLIQFLELWPMAGVPWLLLILLKPMAWWRKALLYAWLMPATLLAHPYPPLFIDLAFAALVLLVATRRNWFRSSGEIAALAIGGIATGCIVYGYFADIIPLMRNTVYPGHRTAPPGTVPISVALSQIFPFLTIGLSDFTKLAGGELTDNGSIGSFFPILTLCLTRYHDLWRNRPVRNAVATLLCAAGAMTLWQVAPVPHWIGRVLLWDQAIPERLFIATGLLLTFACVLVWSNKLVTARADRILIFLLAGPIASLALKTKLFALAFSHSKHDIAICCFAAAGCLIACYCRAPKRGALLLTVVAAINLFEFGRFHPLQPAEPIFNVPQTPVFEALRHTQESTDNLLLHTFPFFFATLNGMGFRSVTHVLPVPQLAFFRKYFPNMDAAQFNFVFNRYATIAVSTEPLPKAGAYNIIHVPIEAFEPISNSRQVSLAGLQREACLGPDAGAIERIDSRGSQLTIEGWAPWKGESATQGVRVLSSRAIRTEPMITVRRPDIAELMRDYAYVRTGFRLRLSSVDGHPLRLEEMVLIAVGTVHGDVRVGLYGCP